MQYAETSVMQRQECVLWSILNWWQQSLITQRALTFYFYYCIQYSKTTTLLYYYLYILQWDLSLPRLII